MGTPDFAIPSLRILVDGGFEIAGIITAPDKPAGRGRKLTTSPIKDFALENNLRILQPTNLKDPAFLKELKDLKANLQIVVAFRMLPERIWSYPEYGTFNLHASLLPQYRGAAPINWAIINGEKETGVTTFFLKHEIDTGNIIFSEKTPIGSEETFGEVHDRLMKIGAKLVLKTVKYIEEDKVKTISQSELSDNVSELKKAPKIYKTDCRIAWNKDISEIFNFIRGLSPYPGAFTTLVDPSGNEHILKIFRAGIGMEMYHKSYPGIHTDEKTFLSACLPEGTINFLEVQLAGKRRMEIREFLRGFKIDERWAIR
jgi:methionyl-tRNA formyltransferase